MARFLVEFTTTIEVEADNRYEAEVKAEDELMKYADMYSWCTTITEEED